MAADEQLTETTRFRAPTHEKQEPWELRLWALDECHLLAHEGGNIVLWALATLECH